jgi:hypothetical protein
VPSFPGANAGTAGTLPALHTRAVNVPSVPALLRPLRPPAAGGFWQNIMVVCRSRQRQKNVRS